MKKIKCEHCKKQIYVDDAEMSEILHPGCWVCTNCLDMEESMILCPVCGRWMFPKDARIPKIKHLGYLICDNCYYNECT